ncbi:hypothetical protein A3740_20385 [Oleiphilus sp. HI0068]|nr:hypothetical protein A3740_20385 [Oleiphilus sp. HI0068]KZY75826.1 hypothetical protein A3741_01655 [Oleiphilus sp. HI0069]KZZ46975.1 hypothetical protein A3755_17240 [Oleiphilus sp. HI0085]
MPGLVKVGMTTKSPDVRAAQLNTTGVPGKFKVEDYWEVEPDLLKNTEVKVHKCLERSRYAKDREFFELSVAEAQSLIDSFFSKEGEKRKAIRQQEEQKVIEQEARDKAYKVKNEINALLSTGVDSLIDNLNNNLFSLARYLESIIPAENVVSRYYKTINSRDLGKPYLDPNWSVDWGGTPRSKKPKWQREFHLRFFLSASFKPFFGKVAYCTHWIEFEYVVNSGELLVRRSNEAITSFVSQGLIPRDFSTLLQAANLESLSREWSQVYGESTKLESSIKEAMICPSCKTGTMVIRYRKIDKKEFLGCDNFPKCRFTFDVVKN